MGVGSGLQLLIRSSGHLIMVLCLRFSYTSFKNEGMKRREQRGEKRVERGEGEVSLWKRPEGRF